MAELTYDEVSLLLKLEPETGTLFWLPRPREMFKSARAFKSWNAKYPGKEALFTIDGGGYKHGTINGKQYMAHRIVWLLSTGKHPDGLIDHINQVRSDNRLSNLRESDHSRNGKNAKMPSNNASGQVGVYFCNKLKKWVATVQINKKSVYLGSFALLEDAIDARLRMSQAAGYSAIHGSVTTDTRPVV